MIALNNVLLPAPFGPITATSSPAPTLKVTSRSAGTPSWDTLSPATARAGGRTGTRADLVSGSTTKPVDEPLEVLAHDRRIGGAVVDLFSGESLDRIE